MKHISLILARTSVEKYADILTRQLDIQLAIVTPSGQILALGAQHQNPSSSCLIQIDKSWWQTWREPIHGIAPQFFSNYAHIQTIAVPICRQKTCQYAMVATGFALDSDDNPPNHTPILTTKESRLILEMLMEMARQLECELEKCEANAKPALPHDQTRHDYNPIVAHSQTMKATLQMTDAVCDSDTPVLIEGPHGVGKKTLAQIIHKNSARHAQPFVTLNCAAFPEPQLISELLGHKRGAFAGAFDDKPGLLDIVNHGTFLLENIQALPAQLQNKLLQILETGMFTPLGDTIPRPINTRIIATCPGKLKDDVEQANFSQALYYKLSVAHLTLPTLAERREDILPLSEYMLARKCAAAQRPLQILTEEAQRILCAYEWPGNLSELDNEITRLIMLSPLDEPIQAACISQRILRSYAVNENAREAIQETTSIQDTASHFALPPGQNLQDALEAIEKRMITLALEQNKGNRTKTAEILGISRRNLIRKIENMHIEG